MRIKSLHISAFGGIKNLQLNLDCPFSVVYGDNENGKTTIMSFIKMMFYGTDRSGAQLSKNPRKKYSPWDGSQMAGSIDFENDGRTYRLERIFGNSNSTDKVTLIDLGLGEHKIVAADIGTKLFGLTLAAFERSIFIGQLGFPESNNLAEGELNSKLSNIVSTGDEAISFEAVNKRLLNAKYELMSKSGRSGIYDKNIKSLAELEKELEKAQTTNATIENAQKKALEIGEEIKSLQEKATALKSKIDSENDFRNAEKLRELLSLKEQLDLLNQSLTLKDGGLADEMFVRKVEFCISKIEKIKSKIDAKQNEVLILENNLKLAQNPVSNASPEKATELDEKIKSLEKENLDLSEKLSVLENTPSKKPSFIPFILASVFAAAGIAAFFWQNVIGIIGFAIAVILLCVGSVLASKTKAQATKTQNEILDLKLKQNTLISMLASEKANLTAVTAALNSNTSMIENQKELIQKGKDDLSAQNTELENENKTLYGLFSAFKTVTDLSEVTQLLTDIKTSALKQKELKQNINYILKDIGNISYDEAREKLATLKTDSNIDFEAVKTEYENILQLITERKTQAASILSEVKTMSAGIKNPENIKADIDALQQKTQAQKEYCDCLDTALSVLTDSYAEVRQSYGSALEKKASDIFAGLTNNRYKNMSISKSFDITVEKNDVFGSKELEYLSNGTQDQAYLSLRLALSELMGDDCKGLPIIMDDALAQYDDTRAKTALAFLNKYSENGQIIFFTCHHSIEETAKEFEANVISL